MPRVPIDASMIILTVLAAVFAVVAYLRDPALPMLGARTSLSLFWYILPRLIPALILTGMLQVVIPQDLVGRYFGQAAGLRGVLLGTAAGMVTPGGPMVSVPLLVALANSGAGIAALVAYMTSWSLFGIHRIITWEAPLMGWRFVVVRVIPSLAFPVIAGWLVAAFYRE
jgi:uncharacterized membrane protein YraQ (UPF0718 family)